MCNLIKIEANICRFEREIDNFPPRAERERKHLQERNRMQLDEQKESGRESEAAGSPHSKVQGELRKRIVSVNIGAMKRSGRLGFPRCMYARASTFAERFNCCAGTQVL